ncbi:MAG: glycosyltransferase [Candidatus Micrarchaeota archaeon]
MKGSVPHVAVSAIIPVHNERRVLAGSVSKLEKALGSVSPDYEILIAEDGSDDGTLEAARGLSSPRVRIIHSEKRLGRGATLSRAIRECRGDIIFYTDADLAADLRHLPELLARVRGGADIATGSRLTAGSRVAGRSAGRDFFSRGYNLMIRLLFASPVRDHQCGFKAFRRSAVLPLLPEIKDRHWFWDTELLILARRRGFTISEIPVSWKGRKESSVRLPKDVIGMGLAALRLRFSP